MKTFFFVILILLASSCSKDKVFKDDQGSLQQKPASFNSENYSPVTEELTTVVRGIYKLVITGEKLESAPCEGQIELNIMSDMQAQITNGELECFGIKIPIQRFLPPLPKVEAGKSSGGGVETEQTNVNVEKQTMENDGRIFRGAKIGDYAFTPPRPFLVGPVVQDVSKFVNYQESKDYTATRQKDDGTIETYSGTIALKILETEAKVQPLEMAETLDHVIKWQMTSEGFENIDHGASFCFPRYEMWWNTNPLAIARLEINDSGSGFAGGMIPPSIKGILGYLESFAEKIGGKVKVVLELKKVERSQ